MVKTEKILKKQMWINGHNIRNLQGIKQHPKISTLREFAKNLKESWFRNRLSTKVSVKRFLSYLTLLVLGSSVPLFLLETGKKMPYSGQRGLTSAFLYATLLKLCSSHYWTGLVLREEKRFIFDFKFSLVQR